MIQDALKKPWPDAPPPPKPAQITKELREEIGAKHGTIDNEATKAQEQPFENK